LEINTAIAKLKITKLQEVIAVQRVTKFGGAELNKRFIKL